MNTAHSIPSDAEAKSMSLAEYIGRRLADWRARSIAYYGSDLCVAVWHWTMLSSPAAPGEEGELRAHLAAARRVYSQGPAVTAGPQQGLEYRARARVFEEDCLRALRNYQARQRRAAKKVLKEAGFSK
jgi:hypothetical protein